MHRVFISTNWGSSLADKYLFGRAEEGGTVNVATMLFSIQMSEVDAVRY